MSQEPVNPYAAPEAAGDAINTDLSRLEPCNSDRRLINLFLDYFCYLVFSLSIGLAAGFIGGEAAVDLFNSIPNLLLGFIIITIYFVMFEATTGRSPAKYLTGTKVVTLDGKKPGFLQILIRTLCRFIPFEQFSFLGKNPRGWHDKISKTMVVRVRDLQG